MKEKEKPELMPIKGETEFVEDRENKIMDLVQMENLRKESNRIENLVRTEEPVPDLLPKDLRSIKGPYPEYPDPLLKSMVGKEIPTLEERLLKKKADLIKTEKQLRAQIVGCQNQLFVIEEMLNPPPEPPTVPEPSNP